MYGARVNIGETDRTHLDKKKEIAFNQSDAVPNVFHRSFPSRKKPI